jgi:hypothetical protein
LYEISTPILAQGLLTSFEEGIMEILEESTHQLGMLKEQIEPLVLFFDNILVEIDKTVEKDLESFLRPITNGIKFGANPDQVQAVELGRTSKKVSLRLQVYSEEPS